MALPAAEQRLAETAARAPGSATARQALGRYYLQANRPFEALWELERTLTIAPRDRPLRVDLATALALAQFYREAQEQLQIAVAGPPSRIGRRDLAALYLATARPEQAVTVLRAAPDSTEWPEGQWLLGRAYEGLGQIAPARRAYERLTRLRPDSTEGLFRLAHLLLTSGDPAGARALLGPALRKTSREARLLLLMAMTYSARWGNREEPDRMGELLSVAGNLGGKDAIPAHLAMGELYLRHGRFKDGGRELSRLADAADLPDAERGMAIALAGLGQPAEAHYYRGMAAASEGHADEALREFQALAAAAPADLRAPQLISQSYAQMKQLNLALKAPEAFYQKGYRSPELFERLATLYLLTYNRRAGRRLCEEWRRADPKSGRPLACLGKISLADLRLADAVHEYEGAIEREPKNAQYLLGLVDALGQQPSPANSRRILGLLRQAIALAPQEPAAHYQLGVVLQQMGQWEEARGELLRALDANPGLAAADNNLLQVATALRQPALARRFGSLMRAIQERRRARDAAWKRRWAKPADPRACFDLGLILARSGELAAAEYQLQRAVELRPGWADAAGWRDRVKHLLDGVDEDGRRLVRFQDTTAAARRRRAARISPGKECG
jgi:tetratricopeptide (TPR) repeat protein